MQVHAPSAVKARSRIRISVVVAYLNHIVRMAHVHNGKTVDIPGRDGVAASDIPPTFVPSAAQSL